MVDEDKKSGTRVFKKTSPNGKITTYLGKRDFIDRGDYVDLIDGMVLIDEEYIKDNRKVTAHLLAAFRYGREDLDVLGLTFRKDLISETFQVYPQTDKSISRPLSRLQERLKRKLGANAFPFWFEVAPKSASSVTLQPAPGDTGKPCGVDYELKTFVAVTDGSSGEKPKKSALSNTVRLAIRKLTYAPFESRPQPMVDVSKYFMMSSGLLHMEVSLDKEMYYHGESISVNVHIQNNSNKTVKKLKIYIIQVADICLFTTASYSCEVARIESNEGFPVGPGGTLSKVFAVCPLLSNNKDKRGLALDGQLKHEDTNLASSTILDSKTSKESLGIVVQYRVKVRAVLGPLNGELFAELPFTLTHSKPPESPERTDRGLPSIEATNGSEPVDIDLIQLHEELEPRYDDDLIFEDFARMRLHGNDSEDQPSPSANLPPSLL
ncbi:Beta-arrestin arr-1 [Caenorhabditis elegans]|uniref:Beta-arrestin arr-1 n=1 Tax=Caenorhabditis elegans TaxID=6239 RepID=ARRB_CAEEL|nr:Beta-arrestin arr-1 [Caenorhabditis elegans]P51485.2 RecName: Full=Beta-arrestin arr-1 [Caenorhabditis elegans]CCD67242.1 Beta-arrestin arr-1 [Caenorhabditis elegans]|eukprot:NP_508183.1 Beta-arrestin arr-1 [Caenorhabditis elegans]